MIALDTNICIAFLKGESSVRSFLTSRAVEDVRLPALVVAELYFGAYNSGRPNENLRTVRSFVAPFRVLDVDTAVAEHYGRIRADLQRSGTPIGNNDMLIAATALAHDAILVTRNVDEFVRVVGLNIETW